MQSEEVDDVNGGDDEPEDMDVESVGGDSESDECDY